MSQANIVLTAEQIQELLEHLSDYHDLCCDDQMMQADIDRVCGFLDPVMPDIQVAESCLSPTVILRVDWFDATKHPAFIRWADDERPRGLASWSASCSHGDAEYPDVFVAVDPSLNGEGSDSTMPPAYWDTVVAYVRLHVRPQATADHILVRITPSL